jgi:hypothetical protein
VFKTGICPIFIYVDIALDVVMKRSSQPEAGQRAANCEVGWIGTGGAIPAGVFYQAALGGRQRAYRCRVLLWLSESVSEIPGVTLHVQL